MSFGFGVGDFLAVIELATKIRKEFAGAPSQYKALSDEVKNLAILLQDVEAEMTGMDQAAEKKLKDATESSKGVLRDLYAFIEKHKSIASRKSPLKRAWQRFSMDSQDISDLRLRIASNVSILGHFTEKNIKATLLKIEQRVEHQDRGQERQKILDWISKDDHKHHRDIQSGLLHLRQQGTRQWLFGSSVWEEWLEAGGTSLYCPGMPGAGKTVTTAMVIEKLQQDYTNDFALAYIFCDYRQESKSDLTAVFARSILRMLLEHMETVPKEITKCFVEERDVHVDQIFDLLKVVASRMIAAHVRPVVIVDALDELQSEARDGFLRQLSRLQHETAVSVLLTSREIPEIRDRIATSFPRILTVEVKATEDDVLCYLGDSIKLLPNVVQRDETLKEEIKITIVNSTRGMRPLSAEQLCHFVSVDLGTGDEESVFDLEDVLELEEILSTCAGLVNYQKEAGQVQFVHQSTKEYFKKTGAQWFPDGEAIMRDICEIYNRAWEAAEATGSGDKDDYTLLDYTKSHWISHHMAADKTTVQEEPAAGAVDIEASRDVDEQARRSGLRRLGRELIRLGDILQRASSEGQYSLVELLLTANPTIKGSDALDNALTAAAVGRENMVMLLMLLILLFLLDEPAGL